MRCRQPPIDHRAVTLATDRDRRDAGRLRQRLHLDDRLLPPVDEADHHLLELAIVSGAEDIVTKIVRHLRSGDLRLPQVRILRPEGLLKES